MFRKHPWFWLILGVGLVLRIALNSAVDSFDFYAFVMWAKYLTQHTIAELFEFLPEGYTPYPPLYYYVLWMLGRIIDVLGLWENRWFAYLIIRIPVILADIFVLVVVYNFTRKHISQKLAPVSAAFYFLHPAIIYNTSVWGQIDSIITVFGLMSLLAFMRGSGFWGIGLFTLGVLTKLQSLALLPLVILLSVCEIKPFKALRNTVVWSIIGVIPFLPLLISQGIAWTWNYFFTIPNWYAYTSVYTLNLWAPFGFIVSDNLKLLGIIEYKYVGIALFWLVAALVLKPLLKPKFRTPATIIFAAFLLWFDFAFFATRIHSRYLIYSFGFFSPFFVRFPLLGILLSIIMVVNFLLPLKVIWLMPTINFLNHPTAILLGVTLVFGVFLYAYRVYRQLLYETAHKK